MQLGQLSSCHRFLLFFSVVFLLGFVFIGLIDFSLKIVHLLSVPVFVLYFVIMRPGSLRRFRRSYMIYFSLILVLVALYLFGLSKLVPSMKIRWIELPIAFWFLISLHIIIWSVDRVIRKIVSVFFKCSQDGNLNRGGSIFLFFVRVVFIICVVGPYLFAMFSVHWIKFADATDPHAFLGFKFEDVNFQTSDGVELEGWYVGADFDEADSTVVIVPGRGTTKACYLSYVRLFNDFGCNVFIFDLRADGGSSGRSRGLGVLEKRDVIGAVNFIKQNHAKGGKYIFCLGISQGASAVVRAVATDKRIDAVAVDSLVDVMNPLPYEISAKLPKFVDWYLKNLYLFFASAELGENLFIEDDLKTVIGKVKPVPIIFLRGTRDNISSKDFIDKIYSLAGEPKFMYEVEEAGHGQLYLYGGDQYAAQILNIFSTTRRHGEIEERM